MVDASYVYVLLKYNACCEHVGKYEAIGIAVHTLEEAQRYVLNAGLAGQKGMRSYVKVKMYDYYDDALGV